MPGDGATVASGLSNGTHTITVLATDAAGNQASSSVIVTVDANALRLSGPYCAVLLIVIVAAIIRGAVLLVFRKRRSELSNASDWQALLDFWPVDQVPPVLDELRPVVLVVHVVSVLPDV